MVLPQPHNQGVYWDTQRESLPWCRGPIGDVHSAAAEDQSLVEEIDEITGVKLFLQLRDMVGDCYTHFPLKVLPVPADQVLPVW